MTNLAVQDEITALPRTSMPRARSSATVLIAYFVDDGSCTPDAPYYPNCGPGGTWVY